MQEREQMLYRVPDYYKQFACLADECPDTCCAGWEIEIDERSLIRYVKYQNEGQPFGSRLFHGVDWKNGTFLQDQNNRCEFLNDRNLCDIYSEAGKKMLCRTCKTYPRHIEEFENIREITLALSCPEAARIIIEKQGRVTFEEKTGKKPTETFDEFDEQLYKQLVKARDYLIEIIQNRNIPLSYRLAKILMYAHDFQMCIKKGELKQQQRIMERHQTRGFGSHFEDCLNRLEDPKCSTFLLLQEIWALLRKEMEVLRDTWPSYLDESIALLYGSGEEAYLLHKAEFTAGYPEWEIECEQLMVCWIYTYFTGAVYSGNAFAKIKLAVVSTVLIRELDIAKYIEKAGNFTKEDQIKICVGYSREAEHSDNNLLALERVFRKNQLFGLKNLLKIVG